MRRNPHYWDQDRIHLLERREARFLQLLPKPLLTVDQVRVDAFVIAAIHPIVAAQAASWKISPRVVRLPLVTRLTPWRICAR